MPTRSSRLYSISNRPAGDLGHHCMALLQMFGRDRQAVEPTNHRAHGQHARWQPSGQLAAHRPSRSDRQMTAEALGFREPTRNSIDTVADRDFAARFPCLSLRSARCIVAAWPRKSSSGRTPRIRPLWRSDQGTHTFLSTRPVKIMPGQNKTKEPRGRADEDSMENHMVAAAIGQDGEGPSIEQGQRAA